MKQVNQMEECKLRIINNDKCETYTCDQVRKHRDEWLAGFRERNGTNELLALKMKDRPYDSYRDSIDEFLSKCKCRKPAKILPVCPNCTKEEHEGYFCRCESRNIQLARQEREEGKSPWNEMGKIRDL